MSGLMLFANNAATTLASSISNTATSLTVATGTGALFPNPTSGQYFYMTLANTSGTVEIVKVTARSTDVFTITRGQDNTSAVSWSSGDKVEQRVVAADLNNLGQLDSTNTWALAQTFTSGMTGNVTGNVSGTAASITGVNAIAQGGTNNGSLGVVAGGVYYGDGTKVVETAAGTSGQVLQSNGSSAPTWGTITGYVGYSSVLFVTSGTWTVPSGITEAVITVVGGGGGAAGTYGGSPTGLGGWGGYIKALVTGLSGTYTITVGSGGTGPGGINVNGNAGTSSSFGSLVSATGGGGGLYNPTTDGTNGTGTTSGTTIINYFSINDFSSQIITANPTAVATPFSRTAGYYPGRGGRVSGSATPAQCQGGIGGYVMIEY